MSVESEQIAWRRAKILELASQGLSQRQLATILQVSAGTINGDIQYLRRQAREQLRAYFEDLPFEHVKAVGLMERLIGQITILQSKHADDGKFQLQCIALTSDLVMKLKQLQGDPAVIQQALQAVTQIKRRLGIQEEEEQQQPSPVPPEELYQSEAGLVDITQPQGGSV